MIDDLAHSPGRNELFKYVNRSSSFEYFMNISSSMRDFILEASYQYKSPIDENRTEINLLQNASLWEEAYYIQAQNDEYNGLSRCVRLTSPIERLTYPNDLWVSKYLKKYILKKYQNSKTYSLLVYVFNRYSLNLICRN